MQDEESKGPVNLKVVGKIPREGIFHGRSGVETDWSELRRDWAQEMVTCLGNRFQMMDSVGGEWGRDTAEQMRMQGGQGSFTVDFSLYFFLHVPQGNAPVKFLASLNPPHHPSSPAQDHTPPWALEEPLFLSSPSLILWDSDLEPGPRGWGKGEDLAEGLSWSPE